VAELRTDSATPRAGQGPTRGVQRLLDEFGLRFPIVRRLARDVRKHAVEPARDVPRLLAQDREEPPHGLTGRGAQPGSTDRRSGRRRAALALVDRLPMDDYHYLHATRAEMLRRLDRVDDARAAYDRALELVHSDAERRFLEQRLSQLEG
jgi:hypothetical protein